MVFVMLNEPLPFEDEPQDSQWDKSDDLRQEVLSMGDSPEAVGRHLQSMLYEGMPTTDLMPRPQWNSETPSPAGKTPSGLYGPLSLFQSAGENTDDSQRTEVREVLARTRRSERERVVIRHLFLVFGSGLLAFLAYVFHQSALAAIPLLGLVSLLILWFVFDRPGGWGGIVADLKPEALSIGSPANATEEYYLLQGELAKKNIQLEMARIDRQIAEARGEIPCEPAQFSASKYGT
jgi:hypothetical protein